MRPPLIVLELFLKAPDPSLLACKKAVAQSRATRRGQSGKPFHQRLRKVICHHKLQPPSSDLLTQPRQVPIQVLIVTF